MSGENRERSLSYLRGLDAERVALLLLIAKGYWPMAKRYLGASGEVDLIMRRGRTIVAVEVKARKTIDAAGATITPTKIARIAKAMNQFRSQKRLDDSYIFRIDAVLIAPWVWPKHIENVGGFG
jgi:putative endonuclease